MIAAAVAILASVVSCPKEIPYRPPDRATAIRLRPHLRVGHSVEEAPSACVTRDGRIYFGLGFYEGEGADGIGGVGMYDPATKKLQVAARRGFATSPSPRSRTTARRSGSA